MRKPFNINTNDNHIIYGTLDSGGNDTLLIFVHGITGNQNEHHYFNAAPFFLEKGFDTFRFSFYSYEPKARPLVESTITTHTKDLEQVIASFKDRYKRIILVGHSLGCNVILKTNLESISRIVLWDPTKGFESIEEKNGEYNESLDKYILHWGMDIIVSTEMIDEWQNFDLHELTQNIVVPCKFIFAGAYNKHEIWAPYLDQVKVESESVIIEGATHVFDEEGTEKELFEETLKWII